MPSRLTGDGGFLALALYGHPVHEGHSVTKGLRLGTRSTGGIGLGGAVFSGDPGFTGQTCLHLTSGSTLLLPIAVHPEAMQVLLRPVGFMLALGFEA